MPFVPSSIQRLRDQLGMSQYGLAKALGCTPQTIFNWEHGRNVPSLGMLDSLHEFCDVRELEERPEFYKAPRKRRTE